MTTIDVAALRALMEKATKGEWEHLGEMFPGEIYATTRDAGGALKSLEMVCEFSNGWRDNVLESAANMALIAAMKSALPALLDAYEELGLLKAEMAELSSAAEGIDATVKAHAAWRSARKVAAKSNNAV